MSDIVTPTMGAKGQLAIIHDEFSRPFLTDDGVTVVKECMSFDDPIEKMLALSMVEAANNTEKRAFDGTTLTVLLTNEFYKAGLRLIKNGKHPQEASNIINEEIDKALVKLDARRDFNMTEDTVRDVANITTKIPAIGELVTEAYKYAGENMNVIIEHDTKKNKVSTVEHVDGMIIDEGYFTEQMRTLCDNEGKWEAENAKILLLAEGILTKSSILELFNSIEDVKTPIVFMIPASFEPEALHILLDNLVKNKLRFMFVFINESNSEEIYSDVAAKTNGKIQSGALGTTDYTMEYAGTAEKIIVEKDKTTIICQGNKDEIERRVQKYKQELEDKEFNTGFIRADVINRRLGNLTTGVTKIKIAAQTITEYMTIKLKLDDAIGAVRCACKDGILLGGGKALYLLGNMKELKHIKKALQQPCLTIIRNAGFKKPKANVLNSSSLGLDVTDGKVKDLKDNGIIDSFTSIDTAIRNAQSIACSYLKAYIIIHK